MQGMQRSVRQSIAEGFYVDIDINNAHPVILQYLAHENGWVTPKLDDYIMNRDAIIKKITDEGVYTRDEIKRMYLIYTNADNDDLDVEPITDHMRLYKAEMTDLHIKFADKYPIDFKEHTKYLKKRGKTTNLRGSFMNMLLCEKENEILNEMFKFFHKPRNAVLCFDGIMLPADMPYDLEACEKHLKTKLDIDIKLSVKAFDEAVNLPPEADVYGLNENSTITLTSVINQICAGPNNPTKIYLDTAKRALKDTVICLLNNGDGRYVTINTKSDVKFKQTFKTYSHIEYPALRKTVKRRCNIINPDYDKEVAKELEGLSDYKLKKESKEKLAKCNKYLYTDMSKLMEDMQFNGELITYNEVDFYPYLDKDICTSDALNMFPGFVNKDKTVDYKKFVNSHLYKHIREDFCDGREDEFEHLMNHITDMIQDPGNIKEDAHVFYSVQGAGKDLFGKFMARLLGFNFVTQEANADRFFKNPFNANYVCKLLLIFQEQAEGGTAFTMANRLKHEITKERGALEKKGIDAFDVNNFARIWVFTNNKGAVRVEPGDRRFTLHRINPRHAKNKEYFAPISCEIDDDELIESAFYYFSRYRKLDKVMARMNFTTQFGIEQQEYSLPSALKFLKKLIESKFDNSDMDKSEKDMKFRVKTTKMLEKYKATGNAPSTMTTQFENLGLESKKMYLKLKNGKTYSATPCYVIHPKLMTNLFRKYLERDNFKFKFMEVEEEPENPTQNNSPSEDDGLPEDDEPEPVQDIRELDNILTPEDSDWDDLEGEEEYEEEYEMGMFDNL
jgi:hypothetical protein